MRNLIKKTIVLPIFTLAIAFGLSFIMPLNVSADFTASPVVIDKKGDPRDIIKETITLTNNSSRRLYLYAFVNNVSLERDGGIEEFKVRSDTDTDISKSLANWISVTRGSIILESGDTKEIDLSIQINLRAQPGKYHAVVFFAEGNTRSQAEGRTTRDRAVLVGVEVMEDIDEFLELKYFSADKNFFTGSPVNFTYILENKGNVPLSPKGVIRVYNRKGGEVGEAVSRIGEVIDPGEEKVFTASLDEGIGMGRFRARIDIEYGGSQRMILNDTTFFHVLPILTFGTVFFVLLILVIWLAHRVHKSHEKRHKKLLPHVYHDQHPMPKNAGKRIVLPGDNHHVIDMRKN